MIPKDDIDLEGFGRGGQGEEALGRFWLKDLNDKHDFWFEIVVSTGRNGRLASGVWRVSGRVDGILICALWKSGTLLGKVPQAIYNH